MGNYETFLTDLLTSTDKVPLTTLTKAFLRDVYLAGTYSVLGIGWSLGTCLTQAALVENSTRRTLECLTGVVTNLVTQINRPALLPLSLGG